VKPQRGRAALLCAGLLGSQRLLAADSTVDAELLEFLGSIDAEGGDWGDYLEHTDLDKIVKPPVKAPAKPPVPDISVKPPAKPPAPGKPPKDVSR